MRRFIAMVLIPLLAVAGRLDAQGSARDDHRRFSIGLQAIRTPAWSLRIQTGTFLNRQAEYESGWVAGLEAGFAPIPAIQVFGGFEANGGGFGDSSGFSAVEGGLTIRPWRAGPVTPFGVASYGRMSESGGVGFPFGTAGAGAELSLGGRWLVRAAVRHLWPGRASSNRPGGSDQTVTVDAEMTRIHFGVAVRF